MPTNLVKGTNAQFSLKIGDVFYPVFCAKEAELNMDQEDIEVTNVNSGPNREYVPGMGSASVNCTGTTTIDNTNNRISITYLMQQAVRRTIQTIQLYMIADNGTAISITFQTFLTNTNLTRAATGYSQSSATFKVTGGYTFSEVIPDPVEPICEVQDPLYIDTVESETSVTSALLVPPVGRTLTILQVQREGTECDPGVPTTGSRLYAYDNTTGTISFDTDNPFNPGETIYVLYKLE